MRKIGDFSDSRNKSWCIHCARPVSSVELSRDHVPSRCLLAKPYPADLPVVFICRECNTDFAPDEEYLVAFLGAVLSGTVEAEAQVHPRSGAILRSNSELRSAIARAATTYMTRSGKERSVWQPDMQRVLNVVLKNARGHAYYEFGEPMLAPPAHIWAAPLSSLSDEKRDIFEDVTMDLWPEVGSRMMTRFLTGEDLVDGWVEVQAGLYRYAVFQRGGLTVRSVAADFLASEVSWE